MNRFTCCLDGQSLAALDPAIMITDVTEFAPEVEIHTARTPRGLRYTDAQRQSLTVSVTFVVRERSILRRAAILQKVAAWAEGMLLTLGHRPGQRLPCVCTMLPEPGSALKWTAPLQVAFTAYACPWWEAVQPATAWITPATTQGSAVLQPVGSAKHTPVEAIVYNQSAETVQELALVCGETRMAFIGLNMLPGERLHVAHDKHGCLTLTILGERSRSVMHLRTADSHDELLARCSAANVVSVNADHPVTAKFAARGRFA